jgi:hypothetical protein
MQGWQVLVEADQTPAACRPTGKLFTAARSALFVVMLKSKGARYNSAMNGTRASGRARARPGFPADRPLPGPAQRRAAAGRHRAEAVKDPQIAKDMGKDVAPEQVAYWMQDLTGIVRLDFLLGQQQDRVGNIDFVPVWTWVQAGEVQTKPAARQGDDDPPAGWTMPIMRRPPACWRACGSSRPGPTSA